MRPSRLIAGVGYTLEEVPVRDWEGQTAILTHSDAANFFPLVPIFEPRDGAALPGENPRAHARTNTHGGHCTKVPV